VETDDKKIKALVNQVDKNHDGQIDFDEFVLAMTRFTAATPEVELKKWKTCPTVDKNITKSVAAADSRRAKSYTRRMSQHEPDELRLCFEKFDKNGDGQISMDELKEVMNRLGEKLTDQELKDMMQDADTNNDGFIDFQEFKALMPNLKQQA
jgi:Ca2+-binding EF-hand superfamily protein